MKKRIFVQLAAFVFICLALGMRNPENVPAQQDKIIESLSISVGADGFRPGGGNYVRIKTYVNTTYQRADIRLRIYNDKGKYIFEKNYKNSLGGYIDYKWKGKPSKKNEAKASAKKFAKYGSYTVEVSAAWKGEDTFADQKSCNLVLSQKASSGKKGVSSAVTVPILTGNAEVDYMAEQICKEAKIKSTQSDDEKVRRIYHWMTVHQKHVHYYEGGSYQKYFKLASSKKKIKAYQKKTDALCQSGEFIYNHDASLIRRAWCMERRIGVCTDNAAIFKILCNHVGVEAGICSGYYLNRNGTKPPHSWNYAIVNGCVYYYDVDVEIQNYKKGQGDYYWYKKTKAEAKLTHRFVTTD